MLTIDLSRAQVEPDARVLDIGCGGGRHAFACLKRGAQVVAIDLSEREVRDVADMVRAMRQVGEIGPSLAAGTGVADASVLPFSDSCFDVVIASEILEHLSDDNRVIAELARVLRPGGVLALSVPRLVPEAINWALSREYRTSPGGHVRIYRRRQLIARLERAPLALVASHHRHALHSPYWWLKCALGLANESNVFVRGYHRLLVWDIVKSPWPTRALDRILNPILGKSLVLYCEHR